MWRRITLLWRRIALLLRWVALRRVVTAEIC
jgi:hypothetical protein